MEGIYTGRVIRAIGGFYFVKTSSGEEYQCRAKGLFRNENLRPLVGDMVELIPVVDTDIERPGSVTKVLPRKNSLIRPAIANVDLAIVFFSAADPAPNLHLMDRFLCEMEYRGVRSMVCLNKADKAEDQELARYEAIYKSAGYRTLALCAKDGDLTELLGELEGRISVLAGPSGAGKSTLVNRLQTVMRMETGGISKKLGRGRHTTRRSELLAIDSLKDSYIADTPGFSDVALTEVDERCLAALFPEIAGHGTQCRFAQCSHIKEKDCMVRKVLSEGLISRERYESYCMFYEDIKSRRKF